MSYPAYRRGTFAQLDGVLHHASYSGSGDTVWLNSELAENPDPLLYDWHPDYACWSAEVPVDRCARVFSVRVYAQYRGHGVLVENLSDTGFAGVLYAEWDAAWATGNGFIQENKYEFHKKVPVEDLQEYYEKQGDLLFDRWRDKRFGGTDGMDEITGRPRGGLLATVSGREYPVLGLPAGGRVVLEEGPGRTVEVPVERCERLADVTTRAEYLGQPCQVERIDATGSVLLRHLGKPEKAAADGFDQAADGRWVREVHVFDLARYHEHHVDLFFDEWLRERQTGH
jgi:hypothetical protein